MKITILEDGSIQIIKTEQIAASDGSTYPQTSIERFMSRADLSTQTEKAKKVSDELEQKLEMVDAILNAN